jgi:hypothetical protein
VRPVREIWWNLMDGLAALRDRVDGWVLGERHALYGAAAARVLTGLAVLGLLLANFSTRDLWVGQASVWAEPARAASRFPELAVLRDVSPDVLLVVYVVTMLAALAFVVGWRTKAANVVTWVGLNAVIAQNPVLGGQSDNLVRLTLMWLLLMRTAEHWSLDARRRARLAEKGGSARAWDDEVLPTWLSTGLHNLALVGLAAQVVLAYMAAGLDKIAQDVWRDGTALYYTMQLPEFRPFPGLSDLLSSSEVLLAVLTYLVLLVQLFFGPLLLNRVSRGVVVVLAVLVNLVFAVLFAAPWSALAVIGVTAVFVSSRFYAWLDEWVRDVTAPVTYRVADAGYVVLDGLDALRYRTVLPVVDWFRATVLRR